MVYEKTSYIKDYCLHLFYKHFKTDLILWLKNICFIMQVISTRFFVQHAKILSVYKELSIGKRVSKKWNVSELELCTCTVNSQFLNHWYLKVLSNISLSEHIFYFSLHMNTYYLPLLLFQSKLRYQWFETQLPLRDTESWIYEYMSR